MTDLFTNPHRFGDLEAWRREAVELHARGPMDEPDHGKYRNLTSDWFKPASIQRMTDRLDELSRQAVAKLEVLGGEADFYRDIALAYPLQVILSILGLPEDDYPRMIKLTQELFGAEDPDLQRAVLSPEQMAGGLRAMAEHPDQLRLLQDDPGLVSNAVDEMIRWTAPVRHFMRNAHVDVETAKTTFVGGHKTVPIRYTLTAA